MREDKTLEYLKSFIANDFKEFGFNLEKLLGDCEKRRRRLDKIIKNSDKQQAQLLKLNEELDEYKNHLEKKVEEEIAKRQEQEKMLFQQSKLAAMGEMMDAVAHQWKQPINIIKMHSDMMQYDFEDGLITQQYVQEFQESMAKQIQHMNSTLDEFRSFFRPNKEAKSFDVKSMIVSTLHLVKDEFIKNNIVVQIHDHSNFQLDGIENEFKHLILNIINNAKDAFNENNTKKRQIDIYLRSSDESKTIEIIDNAGGIPSHVIDDIFKANVTTKEEGKGTGIGLYMSSQIAQKHHGQLSVENVDNGAKFTFEKSAI
jgi:C4-dicarboxylate-specific signal transduction histidine kinase